MKIVSHNLGTHTPYNLGHLEGLAKSSSRDTSPYTMKLPSENLGDAIMNQGNEIIPPLTKQEQWLIESIKQKWRNNRNESSKSR